MSDETVTQKEVPQREATGKEVLPKEVTGDEVTLEYDQIAPGPDGADSILYLSLKKGGKGVPRTTIVLRDVRAGTTKHVMTEADGNVLLPITATGMNKMLLLASSPDPFVERWIHLYFFNDTRDPSRERAVAQYAGKPNRWGLRD